MAVVLDVPSKAFATLGDAIRDKEPTLLSRPQPPNTRPSPPSARPPEPGRPSRIPVYHPPEQAHAMQPPNEPDRSLVEKPEDETPSRAKRRPRTGRVSPVVRAEYVRKALDLMAKGMLQKEAAAALDLDQSTLSKWLVDAREASRLETVAGGSSDLEVVSRELSRATREKEECEERIRLLKAKLRRILDSE